MELLFGAILLILVAAFVLMPLVRPEREEVDDPRIADLEARKEAKYREIRDAQLDREAGKLSAEDFRRQDAQLRADAVEILAELDELRGASG